MSFIFSSVTVGFYFFSSLGYLLQLIFSRRRLGLVALWLLRLGIVAHTILLVDELRRNGYPFVIGEADLYLCASWGIVAVFLAVRARYRLQANGALFVPVALFILIFAIVQRGEYQSSAGAQQATVAQLAALTNPWALVHILFMSLAFAVFALSFLVGITYLYGESQLKNHRHGRLLAWIPSLEMMDGIHYKALTVGFALLSVGILSGAMLSKTSSGKFFSGDPRQVAAVAAWVLYAVFLNVHMRSSWRGRKGIFLSILGFLGVIVAFLALGHRGP